MRKVLYILLTVLAGLLLSATAALAVGVSSSEPPEAYVKVDGKVIQHMNMHEFDWYYEAEDGWAYTADRAPGAPEPAYVFPKLKTAESVKVNIIVRYPDKPEKFYVRTKDGQFISRALYPIKAESGKVVAWGAYFYRNGHHRYVVRVKWEQGKEGHSYGAVTYLAHLKTR
jgi:hypothetical protein